MELSVTKIRQRIYSVRGHQVVLDNDLADFYQTKTKALNQAARRNSGRFPTDFMFQLTPQEHLDLPSQMGSKKPENRGGRRNLPYGFTQEGVSMLSGVLNSDRAVEVNILIMRAFVQLRQVSETHLDLAKRFDHLEKTCNGQFKQILNIVQSANTFPAYQPTTISASYYRGPFVESLAGPAEQSVNSLPFENTAESKLKIETSSTRKDRSKVDSILQNVAQYFGLELADLKIISRAPVVVLPRQIAIFLIRSNISIGYKEIGKIFGGKNHATVIHAYKKVTAAIKCDKLIREMVQTIQNSISTNGFL